ncbi:MAG: hypothetical protein ABF497_13515, partial [Sporolactobacillus sp.]
VFIICIRLKIPLQAFCDKLLSKELLIYSRKPFHPLPFFNICAILINVNINSPDIIYKRFHLFCRSFAALVKSDQIT